MRSVIPSLRFTQKAEELYHSWLDATFMEVAVEIEDRAARWLYWRFGVDPNKKFEQEERKLQQQKEEEARQQLEKKKQEAKGAEQQQEKKKEDDFSVKTKPDRRQKVNIPLLAGEIMAIKDRTNQAAKISEIMETLTYQKRRELLDYMKNISRQRESARANNQLNESVAAIQQELYGHHSFRDKSGYQFGEHNMLDAIEVAYARQYDVFTFSYKNATLVSPLLAKFYWLDELNLMYNKITSLPEELGKLSQLKKLILSHNQLTEIKIDFTQWKELTVLNLSTNNLTTLPFSIGECKSLSVLELEHNNGFKHLPFSISKCRKLSYLGMEDTGLKVIPPEVGTLSNLEYLKLKNTPMKMIPTDVYQKGITAVLEYLKSFVPEEAGIGASKFLKQCQSYVNQKDLSDITFDLNGSNYYGHRCILSVRCPSLLKKYEMRTVDGFNFIDISGVAGDVFLELLTYIYTDSDEIQFINKREGFCVELMSLADFLNLPRLSGICNQYKEYKRVLKEQIPDSTLLQDVSSLWKNKNYQDVAFEVDEQRLEAHKIVLSLRCDYFKSMFSSGLKEAQMELIQLADVSAGVFRSVLEYLYTDDIEEIDGESAIELLTTAHTYRIKRLKRMIENVIGYSLDADNVGCIADVAVLYNCETLTRACVFFIVREFSKIARTDGWKEMSQTTREVIKEQCSLWGVEVSWK
eukprot:TRINITY_DN1733_c0_g1_i3.p1 TRINITY_DN1733_c0_g1~~TRINITY_DN1733_c0_g1_i3.p1  ORF type:complete len:693 (+),score=162.87 TRINITY_DN1733_c0_g1_i3:223-2301(+)